MSRVRRVMYLTFGAFWVFFTGLLTCIYFSVYLQFQVPYTVFQAQTAKAVEYDLSTTFGRELASANKEVSPYKVKNCTNIKHTDGDVMKFCIAEFDGTTAGFYNPKEDLMVVSSFSQYTLIHEITHATILHFYNKGYTDITSVEVQEKMAYNAENLLMQIVAYKEDLNMIAAAPVTPVVKTKTPTKKVAVKNNKKSNL